MKLFSPKQKIIFNHIPKTAGKSIRKALKSTYHPRFVNDKVASFPLTVYPANSKVRVFMGHMGHGLGSLMSDDYAYITCLRDPVELTISRYYWWKSRVVGGFEAELNAYANSIDVLEFCKQVNANIMTRYLSGKEFQRRLDYSHSGLEGMRIRGEEVSAEHAVSAEDLLISKANLKTYSAVFFLDSLNKDIRDFCVKMNLTLPKLKMVNQNPDKPHHQKFDHEVLKQLRELNSFDYELYEYAKQISCS